MKKIKHFSTIIIWGVLTLYTTINAMLTDTLLVDKHYIGLALIGIATISYIFKNPIGHLITLLTLIIGLFGRAALTPSVVYFKMFGITISWPYLILIVFFLIINRTQLPEWIAYIFNDNVANKTVDNKQDESKA